MKYSSIYIFSSFNSFRFDGINWVAIKDSKAKKAPIKKTNACE